MQPVWLFTVLVKGFPQHGDPEQIEIYGGHRERWVVQAAGEDEAAAIIARKVYDVARFERQASAEEIADLQLAEGEPFCLDGFRGGRFTW